MTVKNLPEPPDNPFSRSFHAKRKRKKKGHWNDGVPGNKPEYTPKGYVKKFKKGDANFSKGLWNDGIKGNAKKFGPGEVKIQGPKKRKKRRFGGPKDGRPTA